MENLEMEVKVLEIDSAALSSQLEAAGARKILDEITYIEGFDFVPENQVHLVTDAITTRFAPVFDAIAAISTGADSLIEHGAYLRLRVEGEKSELILKSRPQKGSTAVKAEIEVSIPVQTIEWDEIRYMLTHAGLERVVVQEKMRTSFIHDQLGVRYDIDTWPGVPTYLEVEAANPERIAKGLALVGFTMAQATPMTGREVFKKYGVDPRHLIFTRKPNN